MRAGRTGRVAALIGVVFGLVAAACGQSEPLPFAGYARTPTPDVGGITLPAVEADGTESPFTIRAADDGFLLVYFGYTSCPDVCPTTLADVRLALSNLGDEAESIELAMITIDVEVDTPDVLTNYVRSFVPESIAVRTTDDGRLRAAADVFGADYGKETVDGTAEVYHTGALYVVDDAGRLLLTWPFGISSEDIRSDLERLLNGETVV